MSEKRHITLPKGFTGSAVACGLKLSGKPDLAIIASGTPSSTAAVFTSNQITGAPVQYSRKLLACGTGKTRGIVVNSGCSNVCTGKTGMRDAARMASMAADATGFPGDSFLVASTGIIGKPLDMKLVSRGIYEAGASMGKTSDEIIAMAIMTTDTCPKHHVARCRTGGGNITIAGIAKGAGMVSPSLATMISILTTDAAVSPAALRKALAYSVSRTFNAVTVDGDQSTSDTVAIFASGEAGNRLLRGSGTDFNRFVSALTKVCGSLSRQIASDGEGATRLVKINVTGAKNDGEAEILAKSVAKSPLVKTMIHGADPNWGRIAMALGKCPPSHAAVDPDKLTIRICGTRMFSRGRGCNFNPETLAKAMQGDEVAIDCRVGSGRGSYTALTCDLSPEYVTINADYST